MAHQPERTGPQLGAYRLIRPLGRGTFGVVYLAEHIHTQKHVAVKLLHLHITSREDLKDFLNEARTMRLHHPHIVPILDFGLSREDIPYLVMEYAAGGTLRQRYPKGTKLPSDICVAYIVQLASALQYAHDRYLIHRDIKPENMLLRADDTVLLSDFGIAKVLEQGTVMSRQTRVGTPAYMAPEQSQGKPCPASDQYALAVITYEWLAGQRPFQGTPLEVALQHRLDAPRSLCMLRPDLPQQVEQVLFKSLAKQPEERFDTIEQFAQVLQNTLQQSREQESEPPPTFPLIVRPAQSDNHAVLANQTSPLRGTGIATNQNPFAVGSLERSGQDPSSEAFTHSTPPMPIGRKIRQSFFSRRALLLLLSLLVVFASAGGLWAGFFRQHLPLAPFATTTAQGQHVTAVSERIDASSSATASVNDYNAAIAVNGVQFGFDAQHTHYNSYERILSPSNVAHLKQAWTGQTGGRVDSSPAVANGIVYIGSYQENTLYAFQASGCGQTSCAPLWKAITGGNIYSSPAVINGVVYIGSDDSSLYAFKADGCGQAICPPLWTGTTGGYIDSSPTIANGVVYIGSGDHKLYAFKANGCGQTSCAPLWMAQTGSDIASSPAVVNGVVYVGSQDHKLYAFNANGCGQASCSPLWTAVTDNRIFSSPAVAHGVVYVGSHDHKLYAFKANGCGQTSCAPLWTAQTGSDIASSPAVVNGVVYIGSFDGNVYAFRANGCGQVTCAPLWTARTGDAIHSSPTIANSVLYISSSDGKIYAFQADGCGQVNCAPLWTTQTSDSVNSVPAVANGMLFVGSGDHKLYAFQL